MKQLTTCPYCGVGCGVAAQTDGQRVVMVTGDTAHPANRGRLCVKGSALHDTTALRDRLLRPRVDGVECDWDTALDELAQRWSGVVARHGADAAAMYLSGQLLTEDYYVANKFMKGFVGSANVDTNSRLCMSSTVAGYKRAFGGDLQPCSYEDIDHAELIVLVGSNAAWNHPILYQRMVAAKKANPAMKVVLIDPRETATAELADLHLAIRPGTDALLFNAVLVQLAARGYVDHAYVERATEGFDTALAAARDTAADVADVARRADVPVAALQQFIDWFCQTGRTLTCFSQGINQSSSGTDKVNAIINCHLASGRLGHAGMGPFSLTGQPNAMGGREVGGLANQLAAHMDFSCDENIERVARFWRAPRIARSEGHKAVDMFDAMLRGEVRAVWIMATNPLVSMPDANRVREALQQCELVVVSDCVTCTDTLALAHIVLPATGWSEKDGTVTNSERRISRQRALVRAPGDARHDWWAICQLAQRLGFADAFDYTSPADIFREHARLSGFENNDARGFDISALATLSDEQYDALAPVQWPVTRTAPQGTPRLFADGRFFTASRRARLLPIVPRDPVQQPDTVRPFIVNSGRIRDQWHTMTRTGRAARLLQHQAEPFVDIHPQDASVAGVENGDIAELANALGSYRGRVRVTPAQRRGEVFIPMHWNDQFSRQGTSGVLYEPVVDPTSGQPELKQGRAALRRVPMRWEARLLVRETITPLAAWWARVPLNHCQSVRIADTEPVDDWHAWCEQLPGKPSLWMEDRADGRFRACSIVNNRLEWVLLVEADHLLPDLDWLDQQFAADVTQEVRRQLLMARAAGEQPAGKVICSCFQVREPAIAEAIRAGTCSVEALGEQLRCGTNCGSCVPELKILLRAHAS